MEATDRRELLERELDRAVDLLVNDYGADRIYLFGSLVSNRVSEVSDLDLVVVKESNMVFLDRITEVLALIDPRVGMDVLVYTPSEFERLMADRSFVRNEIDGRRRLLYERED